MSIRTVCESRDGRQGCGAPIVLVIVIPTLITKGTTRRYIPLDVAYDPASGVPASHAVTPGWSTCRPLIDGETAGPDERPAMTHFATCPNRAPAPSINPASTATEGTPS